MPSRGRLTLQLLTLTEGLLKEEKAQRKAGKHRREHRGERSL